MWKSTSDDPFAKILQKMTTSFSRKPRAIPKRGVTAVEPTSQYCKERTLVKSGRMNEYQVARVATGPRPRGQTLPRQ